MRHAETSARPRLLPVPLPPCTYRSTASQNETCPRVHVMMIRVLIMQGGMLYLLLFNQLYACMAKGAQAGGSHAGGHALHVCCCCRCAQRARTRTRMRPCAGGGAGMQPPRPAGPTCSATQTLIRDARASTMARRQALAPELLLRGLGV